MKTKNDNFTGSIPLRVNQCDDTRQKIIGSELHLFVILPGIIRKSLRVRSKSDMVVISANYDERLHDLFKHKQNIDIRIELIKSIEPKTTVAHYIDGVLQIIFDLKN